MIMNAPHWNNFRRGSLAPSVACARLLGVKTLLHLDHSASTLPSTAAQSSQRYTCTYVMPGHPPQPSPPFSHSCSYTPHPSTQATDEDGIPLVAEHVEGVDNRCGRSAALSPYRWHMVQTVVEEEISALHSLAAAVMHATQRLDDASLPPPPVRDVEPDEIVHIDDEPSPGEEEEEEVLEAVGDEAQ